MKRFKTASGTILAIVILLRYGTLLAEDNDGEAPKKKCSIMVHKKNGDDMKVISTDNFSEFHSNLEVKEMLEKYGIVLKPSDKDNEVLTIQVSDNSTNASENVDRRIKVIRIKQDGVSENEVKTLKTESADRNGNVTIVTENSSPNKRIAVFATNDDVDIEDEGAKNIHIRTHVIVNGDEQITDLSPVNLNEDEMSKVPDITTYSFSSLSTDEKLNKIKKAYIVITSDKELLKNNTIYDGNSESKIINIPVGTDIEEQISTEEKLLKAQVYPNPSNGICTLNFNSSHKGKASIEVSNTGGQLVLIENIDTPEGEFNKSIDLSNQPKGVYHIKITQGNAIAKVHAIIE